MNTKLLIIIIAIVIIAISVAAILLHRSYSESNIEKPTSPLSSIETSVVSNVSQTTPPFRTRPLTPTPTLTINVCELYVVDIGAVLKSRVEQITETQEEYYTQREVIVISGHVRVKRVTTSEDTILIKKITIDNPSEYRKKGFDQLADQLLIYFEEPYNLLEEYRRPIYIQIDFNPDLYENYLKPGTNHTITITYLYNGVECTKTFNIIMLSG